MWGSFLEGFVGFGGVGFCEHSFSSGVMWRSFGRGFGRD